MKFPKTLAAVKAAEADQWAIGKALIDEVGKPRATPGGAFPSGEESSVGSGRARVVVMSTGP